MKFTVSEILVSYIKEIRKSKKITVTEFASRIGKSKSYITKFDNGEFKTLTWEDFQTIFNALLVDSPEDAKKAMDDYFLYLLKNDYGLRSVDLDIDICNYCYVIKNIEVPKSLIKKLNQMLDKKNLTIDEIVDCANANTAVKHFANFNNIEYNEYSPIPVSDATEEVKTYIKIKLENSDILPILSGESTETNYFTLLAFSHAYYLIVLKDNDNIDEETKANRATMMAKNLLFNFGAYVLTDSFRLEKNKEHTNKLFDDLLTTPHSIQSTLRGFVDLVTKINKQDSIYAEDKIYGMDKNLRADAGFFFAALDLPYHKLEKLNTDTKKQLLKDIKELINKYAEDESYQEQYELL